jgi:hypothetical protein
MKINCLFIRIVALLLTLTAAAQARPANTDSLVIRFANQTRLVIYAPSKAGIQALTAYDLNKIVRDMGLKLDSLPNGETAVRLDEQQGERYLKDTVLIVTRNRGNVNVVIRSRRNDAAGADTLRGAEMVVQAVKDTLRQIRKRNTMNGFFGVQIGIDGFSTVRPGATYAGGPYDTRPDKSTYFALSVGQRPVLAGNSRVSLSLSYALESVWQNYMFDNNVVARKGPAQVLFADAGEPLTKSKLVNFSLQVPVVPRVTFYSAAGRRRFFVGLGGFVGYRLDSYTKTKNLSGNKAHEHANFYQNDLRYGLVGHIGLRKLGFFVKYELNPVFQPGKGPDIRAFSFGIML